MSPAKLESVVKTRGPDTVKLLAFVLIHLVALVGIFFVKISLGLMLAGFISYSVRMLAVTLGYHRYFSHHAFRTSRFFQALIGAIGCTAFQYGPLWWASHHRVHHRYTDQAQDPHSPIHRGFWGAHLGWLFDEKYRRTNEMEVEDFNAYPEIVWINRNSMLFSSAFAIVTACLGGWNGFYWVVILSTVLVWHATMAINSIGHRYGKQRYSIKNASRNHAVLAILTFGEGWHNNHHRFPADPNFGKAFQEWDLGHSVLKLLSIFQIVSLKRTPGPSLEKSADRHTDD